MGRLAQIETFVQVGREGSFAAAARAQGISPAAISKQIGALEKQLGVQLLLRSTRHVELTEIGKRYYEQCLRIVEEVEGAEALISATKAVPKGKLKVFSTPQFASQYIVPSLAKFLETYPEIEFFLEIGERMPNFELEGIDLMMGASAEPPPDVVQKKIGTTNYLICASPSYLERFGVPRSPDELSGHRCLSHSGRIPPHEFYFQKGELSFSPFLSANDTEILLQLALEGVGVVQLHQYVVQKGIDEGKLLPLLEEYTRREIPLYYFLPPRRYTPSKVRLFLEFFTPPFSLFAG